MHGAADGLISICPSRRLVSPQFLSQLNGGGDSFEIAVIEGEAIEDASPDFDWELLGDGTSGWSVKHTAQPLVSADLSATVAVGRPLEFDVNDDTNEADQLSIENADDAKLQHDFECRWRYVPNQWNGSVGKRRFFPNHRCGSDCRNANNHFRRRRSKLGFRRDLGSCVLG